MHQVTKFLPHHPGGSKIVLQLDGPNTTGQYDPIHPSGTLEEHLPLEAKLGPIDPNTLPMDETTKEEKHYQEAPPPLESLLNLDDIEELAKKQISRKAWACYFSAADDLISKRLNNEAYRSILLSTADLRRLRGM